MRALAKSIKLAGSKLQQSLQPIFLNDIRLAGNGDLPKIIGAQTLNSFVILQANSQRVQVWFVVAELLNKTLPDEQKNEALFDLVVKFLEFLDAPAITEQALTNALLKFKLDFLHEVGWQVHAPAQSQAENILFSASRGGFYVGSQASDSITVTPATWQAFIQLRDGSFQAAASFNADTQQLQRFINDFIEFQLEREIKSEKYLNMV